MKWGRTVVVLCFSFAVSAVAIADPHEAAGRGLFAEGNQLYAAGRLREALAKYRLAYEALPNPKIQLNIGTTLKDLNRFAEAATAYESYLANAHDDAGRMAEAKAALADVVTHVGTLKITAVASDAHVLVDGTDVGVSPGKFSVRADEGGHDVSAKSDSGETTVRVQVVRGVDQNVTLGAPSTSGAKPAADGQKTQPSADAGATTGSMTGPYVLGVGAGVALVSGLVFTGVNISEYQAGGAGVKARTTFSRDALAVSFVAAAVLGGGALIWRWRVRSGAAVASGAIAPWVGSGSGGAVFQSTW